MNTDIYLDVMEQVVLPWIRGSVRDCPWVWQQDSAPCHVSHRAMAWLQEHCYNVVRKDMWPPAAQILILWTILSGAISRLVLIDVLITPRPL